MKSRPTLCTVTRLNGLDCSRPIPEGAPVLLCVPHMIKAYTFVIEMQDDAITADYEQRLDTALETGDYLPSGRPTDVPQRDVSVVYYIRFADRIKIGTSVNLKGRLNSLPYDELMVTEPGGRDLERLRHRQFAADRLTGEWFTASEELMSHVAMLRQHFGVPTAA